MRALNLLREHVRTLLEERKEHQNTLAFATGIHKTTINKFLKGTRELQLTDLDAVAQFFGVATYQLFQPGISLLTERRKVADRRSDRDRRIGHAQRMLLKTASHLDAHRPQRKGRADVAQNPVAEQIRALTERYEREIAALVSQAEPGGQTPAARARVTSLSTRHRSLRGSRPEKS